MIFAEQLAVVEEVTSAVRRLVTYACLAVVAGVLLIAAVFCASDSLWLWADERVGMVLAPLVVAGVLAAVALLTLIVMMVSQRAARKTRARRASHAVQEIAQAPRRLLTAAAEGFLNGLANGSPRSGRV
jgi:uncharacterized membrane protein YedE/YeeE